MSSYDAPIELEQDDLLGRAGFAREIAELAMGAPPTWSVRIGVYGRWGEGKTSVLQLVRRTVAEHGHLVAEFNPWGCSNADEMIEALADALIESAKAAGIAVEGDGRRAAQKVAKFASKAGNAVGDATPGRVATKVSAWLARWAGQRKEDVEAVLSALGDDRRMVVLVDDVDRVDPKLLPRLLFALHEVFALSAITFVVALDPDIVGAALKDYHAGFGGGAEFLAKVIQFPRWLPPPAEQDLLRLAERDRSEYAKFLPADVLRQESHALPQNPRELRSLIRGLWPMKAEVDRHDPDEIDYHLLLVIAAVRQRFPRTLPELLADEKLLDKCAGSLLMKELRDEFLVGVREIAVRDGLADGDVKVLLGLAGQLCGRSLKWEASQIRYHAWLTERPHAVTWREFHDLLARVADAEQVADWLRGHAERRGVAVSSAVTEALSCCFIAYGRELECAADKAHADAHKGHLDRARNVLRLFEQLWFGTMSTDAIRTSQAFLRLLAAIRPWAHFDLNEGDRELRTRERDLLARVAETASDPLEFIERMAPWELWSERRERAARLTEDVLRPLEGRAVERLVEVIDRPSGVSGCLFGSRIADRYLLTRPDPMWNDSNLDRLDAIVTNGAVDVVAENCRLLLSVFVDREKQVKLHLDPGEVVAPPRLLTTLWWGVCRSPVQTRFFNGLDELRQQLRGALGEEPAVPEWWDRVRALMHPSAGVEVSPIASPSEPDPE